MYRAEWDRRLRESKRQLEEIAEEFYPTWLTELASLTGESVETIDRKVMYIAEHTTLGDKYIVINTLLMYYRLPWKG